MIKRQKIWLRYFWLLFVFCIVKSDIAQVYQTQERQTIFAEPDAVHNPTPQRQPPYITYHFKEFNDQVIYANSLKTINWFSQFKNSPFKIENTTFYNPSLNFSIIDSFLKQKKIKLNSLHYYIDVKSTQIFETHLAVNTRLPYEYIYQPFSIGNGEVTNSEYREFIHYVRDSIARTLLAYSGIEKPKDYGDFSESDQRMILKWNKKIPYDSNDEELKMALTPIYLPEGERFYSRAEIDTRKLNYDFWLIDGYEKNVINIVPDTLAWVHDLILSNLICCGLESYCNFYLWHPAYDNYPVVGLSCSQVSAFLFWKTRKLQREMDKKGLNLIVEYDLPNEVELEMIHVLNTLNFKMGLQKLTNNDDVAKNYDFDLYLNAHSKIHYEFDEQLNLSNRAGLLIKEVCIKDRKLYRFIFPSKGPLVVKKNDPVSMANYNALLYSEDLPFLNGNVSEWMHENFSKNDSTIYATSDGKITKWLNNLSNRSITFPFKGNFEEAYVLNRTINNSCNDFETLKFKLIDSTIIKNDLCKLVRGANWFDPGEYATGNLKKTFVPKDSAFSTLGFRYVIRFMQK